MYVELLIYSKKYKFLKLNLFLDFIKIFLFNKSSKKKKKIGKLQIDPIKGIFKQLSHESNACIGHLCKTKQ